MDAKLSRFLKLLILGITLGSSAVEVQGCDQTPPIDQNFDSSLGEDFKPPAQDAAPDAGPVASEEVAP